MKKEEICGGLFGAVLMGSLFLVIMFGWAPTSHFLGKWNDWWDGERRDSTTQVIEDKYSENSSKAWYDCSKQTRKYFHVDKVISFASSTSPDFSTYDCYGDSYTKTN